MMDASISWSGSGSDCNDHEPEDEPKEEPEDDHEEEPEDEPEEDSNYHGQALNITLNLNFD